MASQLAAAQSFQSVCRQWRQMRKLSQLDLALAANISQRHISWLETGRSQPSRDMVIRLSEAMEIPLRERNVLLQSAGFASLYNESALNEPRMAPVLEALEKVLQHHNPLPAVVIDRLWNLKMHNSAAELMLQLCDLPDMQEQSNNGEKDINLFELTLHPKGLRPFISNWEQIAPALVQRLQVETLASGDPEVQSRFETLMELAGPLHFLEPALGSLLPVLPLELNVDGLELSLFSVISTFGTPQDITTDELRIEAFYPSNEATQAFFQASVG